MKFNRLTRLTRYILSNKLSNTFNLIDFWIKTPMLDIKTITTKENRITTDNTISKHISIVATKEAQLSQIEKKTVPYPYFNHLQSHRAALHHLLLFPF
jgi:hypothetical protein